MKKKVLIGIGVVLAIVVVVLVAMVFFKPGEEKLEGGAIGPTPSPERIAQIRAQEKILPLPEEPLEDVKRIGVIGPVEIHYLYDVTDTGTIGNVTNFIIIGTVQNIEGVTNYNPTTEEYTVAKTVGTIKVEKVLKGEINEETIPFIRTGGYIQFSEYKKAKSELIIDEPPKDDEYILQLESDDILIEQGKTYYMLLEYNTDFERYQINFNQYGLREIDTFNGLNLKDNSKIRVTNPRTGSTTPLSSILSQIEKVAEEEGNDSNGNTESQEEDASLKVMPKEEKEKGIIEQIKDFIMLIVSSINNIISAFGL